MEKKMQEKNLHYQTAEVRTNYNRVQTNKANEAHDDDFELQSLQYHLDNLYYKYNEEGAMNTILENE